MQLNQGLIAWNRASAEAVGTQRLVNNPRADGKTCIGNPSKGWTRAGKAVIESNTQHLEERGMTGPLISPTAGCGAAHIEVLKQCLLCTKALACCWVKLRQGMVPCCTEAQSSSSAQGFSDCWCPTAAWQWGHLGICVGKKKAQLQLPKKDVKFAL